MTSPGTEQHYWPYVHSLFAQLDCKPIADDIVWHYTTGTGLLEIIKTGTIFATQVSCLNDATEVRYSASILHDVLTEILTTISEQQVLAFLRRFVSLLEDNDDLPNHMWLPYYVTSFSASEDDLSQWRSYGGGENGYAIGIRTKDLVGTPSSTIVRVDYNAETHLRVARDVAQMTIHFYKEGLAADLADWDNTFLEVWDRALSYVAPAIKNPGFECEKEVRVIHQLQDSDHGNICVLQRKTMMSRHLPMSFPTGGKLLPIAKIMVGPSRHKAITQLSVEALLRAKQYPPNLVCRSSRPYQEM